MPEKQTLERAREDKREGKAPSTQAGEFIREEIDHIREGKHGRPQHETGDRDRAVQGPPGRCRSASAQEGKRVGENLEEHRARL